MRAFASIFALNEIFLFSMAVMLRCRCRRLLVMMMFQQRYSLEMQIIFNMNILNFH